MRKLMALLTITLLGGMAQATLVTDFTGSSLLAVSPVRYSNGATNGVWGGDTRQLAMPVTGGNPDSYLFLQGAIEQADRHISTWIPVADLELVAGTNYVITFDYKSENIDADLFSTFSVVSSTPGGAPSLSLGDSPNGDATERPLAIVQGTDTIFALDNENFAAVATANSGAGWQSYTTSVFQIRSSDDWIAVGFAFEGLDDGAAESIGIDNIHMNIKSDATPPPPPPPPSVLTLEVLGGGQDIVNWTTVQGSGYVYSVYYSTNLLSGFIPLQVDLADTVQSLTNSMSAPVFYKIEAR